MALAAALVAERENYFRLPADLRDRSALGHRVGDRLVEEDVLAGLGRGARRLQVRVVRRGVDDRFDRAIFQDRLVARRRGALVLRGAGIALVLRAREAGAAPELLCALYGA